jgi:hypothetical protein
VTRALSLAVIAVALAGCGSSSPSLSRLRRQATAVCQRALANSARIKPPVRPSATGPFVRRGASVLSTELSELRMLKAPAESAASYSSALGAQSRQLTILDDAIRDLDGGADPVTAIKTLQRRLAPTESAEDAAWRTLDIPACAVR